MDLAKMSSRSSQRTVVNSVYGDRPILNLPSLGGIRASVSGNALANLSDDFIVSDRAYGTIYDRNTFPYYSTVQLKPPSFYGLQTHYGKSNISPAFPYSDYQSQVGLQNMLPYGSQSEVHYYYGPNGEKLSGPPDRHLAQAGVKQYVSNFTVEGQLEYGKMISVKIISGNISFHDIPDFVLADIKRAYRLVSSMKVIIIAEGGEYSIYSEPIQQNDQQSLLDDSI